MVWFQYLLCGIVQWRNSTVQTCRTPKHNLPPPHMISLFCVILLSQFRSTWSNNRFGHHLCFRYIFGCWYLKHVLFFYSVSNLACISVTSQQINKGGNLFVPFSTVSHPIINVVFKRNICWYKLAADQSERFLHKPNCLMGTSHKAPSQQGVFFFHGVRFPLNTDGVAENRTFNKADWIMQVTIMKLRQKTCTKTRTKTRKTFLLFIKCQQFLQLDKQFYIN